MLCMKSPFYFLFQWTKQNCIDWPIYVENSQHSWANLCKKVDFSYKLANNFIVRRHKDTLLTKMFSEDIGLQFLFYYFCLSVQHTTHIKVSNSANHLCKHQIYDVIYSITLSGPIYMQKWANLCWFTVPCRAKYAKGI